MAECLAGILGYAHIELDALHWLPDWEMRPLDSLRGMVTTATAAETWVADGNYSKVRDIAWARATTVVWLNWDTRHRRNCLKALIYATTRAFWMRFLRPEN